ncbi:glyoxylase-like metal-dependent hydrolase (beta-lactamase superfamily II) [Larkinella arboricola]|uniref:Glyoxylase-like metal-dependent hydrolase (Beta-lactamase superfamily II) n=1 Tax=Larkinella arboricola TaxID=643671 RepID=A0A327WQJ9_LARAB|nr:MBL fold metallo-hydrolase [Larkinella arboricola]RAJ93177.1 glyoxylase-like metal-dependent hydrolase (beta-lactamase superfamily II) [Larkinella arboricola]
MLTQTLTYLSVKTIERDAFTIHCVQAPEDGELVNAQVIETPTKLLLVDTLQLKPHADELRTYIESLGKPLDRVIISHYHPDHWFGAATFRDYPLYALPDVIDRINQMADFVLNYHRNIHGEKAAALIPSEKVTPDQVLAEGEFVFDGLTLNLIKITDTEAPVNLVIELPDYGILLPQDLVYNGAYPYFGEKTADGDYCFDAWIAVLRGFQEKNYNVIVPGHGDPTDASIFPTMITYLEFAKEQVLAGLKGEELINRIKQQYPDYRLPLTLVMSDVMLFQM